MDDSSPISLFANFDSANMARYERVYKSNNNAINQLTNSSSTLCASNSNIRNNLNSNSDAELIESTAKPVFVMPKYDVEFNVWTKPDCDGLPGENSNRTWFYFGVRGGHGKWLKLNIMNLNKQGRLFEMGMLPVFKTTPGHEKWSRIYTKPTWQSLENTFILSFIHKLPEKRDTTTYFAFCFPFSYEETQDMLTKYDEKFSYCKNINSDTCDLDDIYYHRELLCHSLDKRRVDLITISACNMTNLKREPRFDPDHLFPKPMNKAHKEPRCYSFNNKRVFVLTSRVHPGETPASFIFNGFIEFILRRDDPRAKILRRQFVFKLVPLLNPDGVARGHYRTDQTGTNLNRVYLNPDFNIHPTIYAIKSLLVFYHINNRISREHDGLNFEATFKLDYDNENLSSDEKQTMVSVATTEITEKQGEFCSASLGSTLSGIVNEKTMEEQEVKDVKEFTATATDSVVSGFVEKSVEKRSLRERHIGNENSDEDGDVVVRVDLGNENKEKVCADHLSDPKLAQVNPLWSGIAFYIDLHAHAAKRGVFMYGNSIDNELFQTENVLFAKLIALSSQHFDFEGSNFSTKNMYARDKREGLSKEGSGRVGMFKALGIIHSYTVEGCYASGRVMNTIAPAINTSVFRPGVGRQIDGNISPALHSDIPPKFLPEHYADVGKAIAIAALDIIEMNPNTRIPNTSFGSLEALRNWIKFYIKSKNGGGFVANPANKTTYASLNINTTTTNGDISQQTAINSRKPSFNPNQKFYLQQRMNRQQAAVAANTNKLNDLNKSDGQSISQKSIANFKRTVNKPNASKFVKPTTPESTFKRPVAQPNVSAVYQMDETTPRVNVVEKSQNSPRVFIDKPAENSHQLRNSIKLIKDLEINNSSNTNSTVIHPGNLIKTNSSNNLIKKNLNYQNQLRLKIAARKSNYALMRSLTRDFDQTNLTIDYQKQEISTNLDEQKQQTIEPQISVEENRVDEDGQFTSQSRSKLTVRALLPISKANVVQNNNNNENNNNHNVINQVQSKFANNSSQNILFFNKLTSSTWQTGASGTGVVSSLVPSSGQVRRTLSVNSGRQQTPDETLMHHKKVILSSIKRNSGRNLSRYLKCNSPGTTEPHLQREVSSSRQKVLKKYASAGSRLSGDNLVNISFTTVDPRLVKKIDK